jgi:hypothetical protein
MHVALCLSGVSSLGRRANLLTASEGIESLNLPKP